MANEQDRPRIYEYLDKQFGDVRRDMGRLNERMAVVEARSKPSPECSERIEKVAGQVEERCNIVKKDVGEMWGHIHKKLSSSTAKWGIGILIAVIIGAYGYTYRLDVRLNDKLDKIINTIGEMK